MQDTQLSQISNFIWGVADDYLRDLYVRGKYRDVILPDRPPPPGRRSGAHQGQGPGREEVAGRGGHQDPASVLELVAGQAFCNPSQFSLNGLTSRSTLRSIWT